MAQPNKPVRSFTRLRVSMTLGLCLAALCARAQAPGSNAQPTPDPLMMLMLSQPPIDVRSTVQPLVSMEPPIIRPGGQASYRVVLNAMEAAISWPERLPQVPGLELRAGGHGQVLQPGGTNLQPRTTFLYRALPKQAGRYTIPEFQVRVYGQPVTIPSVTLEVSELPPDADPRPQVLQLSLGATNLFVGQAVRARLTLPGDTNGFQSLAYVKFMGDGVVADQSSAQQRIEASPHPGGGPPAQSYTYDILLTPIAAGDIAVFAQGYTASSRFSGPIIISGGTVTLAGGPPQFKLLDSDPVVARVRPLPKSGILPGFKGAIGSFHMDSPRLSTNRVQVGQPVKLTVHVRGDGNIARLVPPDPPRNKQWQGFAAPIDPAPAQIQHMQGSMAFHFHFIPLSDETTATPAIPYSYFNPYTQTYVNLTIPAVPITVVSAGPATAPVPEGDSEPQGEVETLSFADVVSDPGALNGSLTPVQERSWFPILQIIPALLFFGLAAWDRRRRYMEQHPEVRVRRRALRALRRHRSDFRAAANAGDIAHAVPAGVHALQAGCAPFFPAEPRALVGAEVISLLSAELRNGPAGEAVRLLFDAASACSFGAAIPDLMPIQNLAEVDRVLGWLEERLRL